MFCIYLQEGIAGNAWGWHDVAVEDDALRLSRRAKHGREHVQEALKAFIIIFI